MSQSDRVKDHGDVFSGANHRQFVGGRWDEMGQLQFEFLKLQGLTPDDVFIDVGCGSLRAGVWLIPYLNRGNYLGLEAEEKLLARALDVEVPAAVQKQKRPEFVVTRNFEFSRFSKVPNFGIAQSLFTHLNENDIMVCLRNLRAHSGKIKFFVTFFEVDKSRANPELSHAQKYFAYTVEEMFRFGSEAGFDAVYIGDWGHPKDQRMLAYF